MESYLEFKFLNENVKIYNSLMESLATAKKAFVQTRKITQNEFKEIVEIDPSKTKKYLNQLCLFYIQGAKIEELQELITIYDTLLNKRLIKNTDINSFKTFDDFKQTVDLNKDKQLKTSQKEQTKIKDAEIILDNDDFLIVSPNSHSASCIYGAGTKWCISRKESRWWNEYAEKFIKHYFIINKKLSPKNRFYKITVSVYQTGDKEVFDAQDKRIDFKEVIQLGIDENIFKPMILNLEKILEKWVIGKYEIINGEYNVNGDVTVINWKGDQLPIQFKKVTGNFNCINNGLKTLKGVPEEVGRDFWCVNNQLTSLEGSPKEVGGGFYCNYNKLTSLKGNLEKVGRSFQCSYNQLTSLEGSPKEISGDFKCDNNKLTSLEGGPKEVGGTFDCSNNKLTSLEGSPKEVGGDFKCSGNAKEFTDDEIKKYVKFKN
jgi:hypothetical protein